jgi:iron complex transport system substrate-binding protein
MKIISLAPSNTEILFSLGLGDSVVAITHFCDWPPEAREKNKIGAWINTEPEKIATFKPDLIFTSYFLPEALRQWRGPGKLVHVAPKTLSDVYKSILKIGEETDRLQKAESIVERMKENFEDIKKAAPSARPRLYMEEWFKPPMSSGNWVPEVVEIAGGIPGIAERGVPSGVFAFQKLEQFDPDALIFHWCGFGKPKITKDRLLTREKEWHQLRAFRENKMFSLDDSTINRPGPRLPKAARMIQEIIKKII